MKNILLPTDFSENSWNAITYAINLFEDEPCMFFILHTYTPIIYHVEYVLGYPAQFGLEDTIRHTALENLKTLQQRIEDNFRSNPNHKFQTLARFDTLISGINKILENHEIHMIVMGTKGAKGAKEVLFGTNTVQVFKHIKSPILAIPENYTYNMPHTILFPTDYGLDYQLQHLEILLLLAKKFNARIDVLHILTQELTETKKRNKARLHELLVHKNRYFHEVSNKNVMAGLNDFQEKKSLQMMVMINNKPSFFENIFFTSTTSQIGFSLKIPLLLIPSINNHKI